MTTDPRDCTDAKLLRLSTTLRSMIDNVEMMADLGDDTLLTLRARLEDIEAEISRRVARLGDSS